MRAWLSGAGLFFIGLSGLIKIQLGGELFLPDILFAAILFLKMRSLRFHFGNMYLRTLIVFGLFWSLNLLISDVYNGTPQDDWSRGWAKLAFFFTDLLGLAIATDLRVGRIALFVAGTAAASLLTPLVRPDQYSADFAIAWKFYYGGGLASLAIMLDFIPLWKRAFRFAGEWVPLAIIGLCDLALNARSAFGTIFATLAYSWLKKGLDTHPALRARFTPMSFALILAFGVIFIQGLITVYSAAAGNGWLGLDAQDKYISQSSGDLSLIQAGRVESLVSLRAISDAPIVGHGSWAKDVTYVAMLVDLLEANGVPMSGDPFESPLIPSHSFLFGAWVEAGLFGGLFWLVLLVLVVKAAYILLKRPEFPGTFVAFVLFALVWDILFSPFGAAQRFQAASKICVVLAVLNWKRTATCQPQVTRAY